MLDDITTLDDIMPDDIDDTLSVIGVLVKVDWFSGAIYMYKIINSYTITTTTP